MSRLKYCKIFLDFQWKLKLNLSAYAQAGLSLCWSHIPHCWKSHVTAQISFLIFNGNLSLNLSVNCQSNFHSWGYERLQKSKDSLKAYFENVIL